MTIETCWTPMFALAAGHPAGTAAVLTAGLVGAWFLHVWRLRCRERDLIALVEDRTRRWREEADALAELRGRCEAKELTAGETQDAPDETERLGPPEGDIEGRVPRVLVIDDRPERREAITSMFGTMGIEPAFADSRWAATVASSEAEAEGFPFDLVLIGKAMDAGEADTVV